MKERLLYAHTPNVSPYPPYVNATETEEGVRLIVRSPATDAGECGPTASVVLGKDVWAAICAANPGSAYD